MSVIYGTILSKVRTYTPLRVTRDFATHGVPLWECHTRNYSPNVGRYTRFPAGITHNPGFQWSSFSFLFFCRKDTFAPRTDRSSLSPGNSTPTRVPTFGTRSGGYEGPPRTRVTRWTNRPRDRPRMMVATAPSIRSKKVSLVFQFPYRGGNKADFAI